MSYLFILQRLTHHVEDRILTSSLYLSGIIRLSYPVLDTNDHINLKIHFSLVAMIIIIIIIWHNAWYNLWSFGGRIASCAVFSLSSSMNTSEFSHSQSYVRRQTLVDGKEQKLSLLVSHAQTTP